MSGFGPKQPWVCSKKTKTAGLLKNEISNFVGLHFYSRTHPRTGAQKKFAMEGVWKLKFFVLKIPRFGGELSKVVQLNHLDKCGSGA